jgi:hypothetical protein
MPSERASSPHPMLQKQSNTRNGREASMRPSVSIERLMMYKEFNYQIHSKYDEAARSKAKMELILLLKARDVSLTVK